MVSGNLGLGDVFGTSVSSEGVSGLSGNLYICQIYSPLTC